jgi:nucleotide-binding universal stress UspA family protein
MDAIAHIVVGVDFSPQSRHALDEARRIAEWTRARVHVLHVIDAPVVEDVVELAGVTGVNEVAGLADQHVGNFATAERELRVVAEGDGDPDRAADAHVRVGHVFIEIVKYVRETSADLLVLGASGAGDTSVGAGAFATQCVRRAPVDVLLVRGAQRGPFRRVVAAVDYSTVSRDVVGQAVRLACQDQARLDVLHVYRPPVRAPRSRSRAGASSSEIARRYERRLEARMDTLWADFATELRYLNGECRSIGAADCESGIIEFVRNVHADLVVLGTRNRVTRGHLAGTTAERVVREAPCSVLAIRPRDSA